MLTKKSKKTRIYSQTFKSRVIEEYKNGFLSIEKLQRKYGITKSGTILKWIKEDGSIEAIYTTENHFPFKIH
ncbi:transposase [Spongiivirga sp. MCCC 1A20706]|uniref:hypothetical protein n=1 Tax=Spongiivirga sp. MCCC 1A20706 TaxID=3160963 RepID=UPI0039778B3A